MIQLELYSKNHEVHKIWDSLKYKNHKQLQQSQTLNNKTNNKIKPTKNLETIKTGEIFVSNIIKKKKVNH